MNHLSHKHIKKLLSLTLFLGIILQVGIFGFVAQVGANYGEADSNSFVFYKQKLESSLQDLEREFRVNNTVTDASLNNIRGLVQEAYIRLPDSGDKASENESLKKNADLYLDLAVKNKSSSTHVSNAASQVTRFKDNASIEKIVGSIAANPTSGNAPFTSSFLATAKDPSGVNIPDRNFIWWMKGGGGSRLELQRGPTLTYTFNKEGNYQVFLDVMSESKNKKGKVDVTPLSISQDIEVKPRLGNVILLVNGVNISNLDLLKVNPTLGKIGLLFDATASRAVSNGTIVKTKWDFGNGNVIEYAGGPVLERQLFTNEGMYKVSLDITTNQGQSFRKQFQLLVRDPAAVIVLDKEVGYIGEEISMTAKSYLANTSNVEYSWKVQDNDIVDKPIVTQIGSLFTYKPKKVGQYLVTLTSRSPNGNTDSDTRFITIESRPPIINLDSPKPLNSEKPNTMVFDASRTYDPDTKSAKDLSYQWNIDGEDVILSDTQKGGSIGTYYFSEKGQHSVTLTVANAYGKVATIDKTFSVASTLTIGMNISPRAAAIGSVISFQARSPQARFFEWNAGDGSAPVNGTSDYVQHIYKKTGIYSATLSVKNGDGSEQNTITRKIYITDTDNPFALIDVKNGNGTVYEDPTACDSPDGAFVINRAESTSIDGGNSINIDGNTSGLSYTWKYFDRIKTTPLISEKFTELGCFPVELTVRSDKNGASHTSKRFIQIKNIIPKLTSVDASIDATKKDTQKVLVNVVANGARDDDGVITSYIWFYTTESDTERQNVRITQSPSTTFILPNVTEKYYFGVILEDNDGARLDSNEAINDQGPLLIANDDANINMPLISLTVDKTQALTDENIKFSASAKNILGADITTKSEYYWDFDGDGHIDQKTTEPQANYTYKKSGKFNMKLKVTSNGTSNTKYQLIYIKNELKANTIGYRVGNTISFLNTSRGSYDSAVWTLGTEKYESLYGTSLPSNKLSATGSLGNLTIKSGVSEVSSIDITPEMIEDIVNVGSGLTLQSYPKISDDTITISSPGEKVLLSAYGNNGKEFIIDTDTKIDSDIDGVGDNDKDNINTSSYSDGSVFSLGDLSDTKTRAREMKITVIGDNGQIVGTKIIKVIFDYIKDTSTENTADINGSGSESFSETDKQNLEKLQAKIRTLGSEDRIIFTQHYNNLIENWDSLNDRTEGLLTIQKEVTESKTLDTATKDELSAIIDIILVGDAQATNEISVATHLIEGLISTSSPNRDYIIERIEQIKAHPASLAENKTLGKEILQKIQEDTTISTENKILIKSQLLIIVNGGQENVSEDQKTDLIQESTTSGSALGFVSGAIKIFGIIIGIIILLFFLGYIVYRLSRKSSDMGFQDFLIDSIAHNKSPTSNSTSFTPPSSQIKEEVTEIKIIVPEPEISGRPLESNIITPASPIVMNPALIPIETTSERDPLGSIGAWTPPPQSELIIETVDNPIPEAIMVDAGAPLPREETHAIPDWLKPITMETPVEAPIISPALEETPESSQEKISQEESHIVIGDIVSSLEESAELMPLTEAISDPIIISSEESANDIALVDPLNTPMLTEEEATISSFDPLTQIDSINPIDTPENTLNQTPTSESLDSDDDGEDMIPDWLKPLDTSAHEEETHIDVIEDDESLDTYKPPIIIPPPPDTDLPEWLKSSIENKESSPSEKPKKQKTPQKTREAPKSVPKKKADPKPKKTPLSQNSGSSDDIPDWLK